MNIDVHMCVVPVKVLFRCQRITMCTTMYLGVPTQRQCASVCLEPVAADFLDFIEKK